MSRPKNTSREPKKRVCKGLTKGPVTLLTITLILFVVASIGGAVTAHLDHTRLRALDRVQNAGPIPNSIARREGDRPPHPTDRELEAYGRT